jgi:hypothetical protein
MSWLRGSGFQREATSINPNSKSVADTSITPPSLVMRPPSRWRSTMPRPNRPKSTSVPFVAAVSVDHKGHPLYVKRSLVSGFRYKAIGKLAKASLLPGWGSCAQ